jgi:hypothetical protein
MTFFNAALNFSYFFLHLDCLLEIHVRFKPSPYHETDIPKPLLFVISL